MRPQIQIQHNLPPGGMQMDGIGNVMAPSNDQPQPPPQMLDTSQPPPIRPPTSAALLPPPNPQMQMMPPGFPMSNVPRKSFFSFFNYF